MNDVLSKLHYAWSLIAPSASGDSEMRGVDLEGLPFNVFVVKSKRGRAIWVSSDSKMALVADDIVVRGFEFRHFSQGQWSGYLLLDSGQESSIFDVMICEMLDRRFYRPGISAVTGIKEFARMVGKWARYFERGRKAYQDIKGVFGEVFFLRELLKHGIDKKTLVNSWMIHQKSSRVDFRFDDELVDVEVKTVESGPFAKAKISSIEQLSEEPPRGLYLVTHIVSTGGGESICDVCEEVVSMLDSEASPIFCRKLDEFGFPRLVWASESNHRFLVEKSLLWRVDAGFPCLDRSSIHPAIVDGEYSIELSKVPSEFFVDSVDFVRRLKG